MTRETETDTSSRVEADACLQARFEILAKWWRADTISLSSPTRKLAHPAYQEIIGLGMGVVPYILEDLRNTGCDWFAALEEITQESPIQGEE
jgi:hypothetical protein